MSIDALRRRRTARVVDAAVWGVPAITVAALAWLLADVVWHGAGQIDLAFLTTAPRSAGRAGGIAPMLVSTAIVVAIAVAVALPLAVGTAVLLVEVLPPSASAGRWIRRSLDILAGMPSIVFGLFGNLVFCTMLGMGFSLLSGGLTLACMVLPILMRAAEESLRGVPDGCRRGALALGMPRHRAITAVILPCGMPGIIDGLTLGVGRAMAETAALVFTSGYVDRMPSALTDSGRTLAVHVFDLSMNVTGGDRWAYATALVLIGLLLVTAGLLSLASRFLQRKGAHKP
ncbi:phosphate ABC transporter membrane protein 2 (PhoT family) [Azospirillum brasilense]|uniref:Phosphate transport system permease protein PstA n=1 Tax=Azospirillum brasilense TaxID=192 RepID=A0A560CSR4_AZOBR|nr:phosphate ABC transporter permease PstA [Azospirillum brasilense]TWA87894.1 phosphate ABC transporter membrane protein 2 (PhoT family) [Azospirillum brasilense]